MKEKFSLVSTFIWLLSVSVLVTIYLAWLAYPLEVDYLKISQTVYMTKKSILYNFNGLMQYLTNPLVRELHFASFTASKAGLAHFADVKGLFQIAQALFLITSIPALLFLSQMIKHKSLWLFRQYLLMAILLPFAIAIMAVLFGFDQFFVFFHKLLFAGKDNWVFDPLTDPIIWILPEKFFMHCFILFLTIYEVLLLGLYWLGRRRRPKNRKQAL
ncbi:TIGR01906 family membrane protein [Streptococcus porcinus]|uniref:TIGR01906 family protein n=1 Tax=Streptococcus porcinus TaxID=1340 RepID=A0A4V0H5W9_STRPO|nr:TIGR01906 family membrane protein [Streptococcus porcinus]VTT43047.1 TIGR01906 family protein [Streptococcus porcinus]VTT44590.1 TIGR01906 family protein [Streptococcus porcinus]